MKNSLITEKEQKLVGEVIQKISELVEYHQTTHLTPQSIADSSDLEKIHIVIYLDTIADLVKASGCLNSLLGVSEEDFTATVTDDGKKTLKEAKNMVMMKLMTDMITSDLD